MDSCRAWHETERMQFKPLSQLRKGTRGIVSAVSESDSAGSNITRRLLELGFIAGERIEVIEEVRPGRDPIAVRIGSSMFALRRREAAAVLIQVEAP